MRVNHIRTFSHAGEHGLEAKRERNSWPAKSHSGAGMKRHPVRIEFDVIFFVRELSTAKIHLTKSLSQMMTKSPHRPRRPTVLAVHSHDDVNSSHRQNALLQDTLLFLDMNVFREATPLLAILGYQGDVLPGEVDRQYSYSLFCSDLVATT